MDMESEKETWINAVMGSADGLQRAEPNPFLYAKIRNQLIGKSLPGLVSRRTIWLALASFSLLVLLNGWIAVGKTSPADGTGSSALNTVATEMQLYPTTDQLYDAWNE